MEKIKMSLKHAVKVGPSEIEIAYETFGADEAIPVLMLMGTGAQMLNWHEDFCTKLVSYGIRPIRFDNRDAGLSTHFHHAPEPDFKAAMAGDFSSVSYNLSDMAADTVGLLDFLGLKSAHFVGASMGGFISQMIAIEYPDRIRSMTCIMSTTGDPSVGYPASDTLSLLAGPPPTNREEAMEQAVKNFRVVGSPGFPLNEDEVRERAGLAYDRSYDLDGMMRQAIAVIASGDRTSRLESVKVPTLVIHGDSDKMCDVSGGRAIAKAIKGSELVIIEGMGHNLPRPLWPRLTSLIANHVLQVEANISK
jgi:pimeloyl-ACP methyl ester carboxylesterase